MIKNLFGIQRKNRLHDLRTMTIHDALFIALSLFYFIFAFHLYQATKGFPGFIKTNVDEIYFTHLAAFNYHYFGLLNSFCLPDYASGINPASHPYVYTHNIAFPNLIGYIMMLFGLTKLELFSFISIFLSYAGYSTGYFLFRKYVGRGVAIILFFMITTNYHDVLTHSLGFFRPFQWILFFAVPYVFLEWSKQPKSNLKTGLLFLSLLFAVSYEYTFAFKLYFVLILLYLFNVHNCRALISCQRLLLIMMLAFIIPKSLQFIMVWGMFGFETAIYDNLATLANRILPAKDTQQLVEYYSKRGILFWTYVDKRGIIAVSKSIVASYGIIPVISSLFVVFVYSVANSRVNIFKKIQRCEENIKQDEVTVCLHIGNTIRLGLLNKEHRVADIGRSLVMWFAERIRKLYFKSVMGKPLIIHIIIAWLSLSFGYNSYKWWMRHGVGWRVSHEMGADIKATFPWAIVSFIVIYLIITLWKNRKITYLSFWQYVILLIPYSVLMNIIFYSSEPHIRIIQNVSVIYICVILFLSYIIGNYSVRKTISNKLSKMITIIRGEEENIIPIDSIGLISCMMLSVMIYVALFYTHVYMVNIGSFVPLIEMYTISGMSLVIYLVYRFILQKTGSVYFCILIILIGVYAQSSKFIHDYYRNPPLPMAAYDVLPKYRGKSFLTSYHSVYPTLFTKAWAIPNWGGIVTRENVTKYSNYGYVWLKDKYSPEKQKEYSAPEYYLHIYRILSPSIDLRMKNTYEMVEKGDNYEIYKLR
jgi:hypothetical protein